MFGVTKLHRTLMSKSWTDDEPDTLRISVELCEGDHKPAISFTCSSTWLDAGQVLEVEAWLKECRAKVVQLNSFLNERRLNEIAEEYTDVSASTARHLVHEILHLREYVAELEDQRDDATDKMENYRTALRGLATLAKLKPEEVVDVVLQEVERLGLTMRPTRARVEVPGQDVFD